MDLTDMLDTVTGLLVTTDAKKECDCYLMNNVC